MKKLLRLVKRLADHLFGTLADELFWRLRHRIDPGWALKYLSPESLAHPHRKLLVDTIARCAPFKTALEVGCASGPNLFLLRKRFPEAKLAGVDVSAKAIATGKQWLEEQGVWNVSLKEGRAWDLRAFPAASFDLVFTDAALIYMGPDKIKQALQEICRVARKAIVLNEWHDPRAHSPRYDGHWIYNYEKLLRQYVGKGTITATKIPEAIWGGSWATYGYIIEAKL